MHCEIFLHGFYLTSAAFSSGSSSSSQQEWKERDFVEYKSEEGVKKITTRASEIVGCGRLAVQTQLETTQKARRRAFAKHTSYHHSYIPGVKPQTLVQHVMLGNLLASARIGRQAGAVRSPYLLYASPCDRFRRPENRLRDFSASERAYMNGNWTHMITASIRLVQHDAITRRMLGAFDTFLHAQRLAHLYITLYRTPRIIVSDLDVSMMLND